jgi:xanthine dehydrogenase YagT iron-sulfur-binding subunit
MHHLLGRPAPDFALVTANGESRRLADFRGSPLVVVFHPPGWNPTRQEHVDAYNRLIAHLPGMASARLVSVGGDGPWRSLGFDDAGNAGNGSVSLPVLDGESTAAESFGVRDTSAVFVIDAEGIVRWSHEIALNDPTDDVELGRSLTAALAPADDAARHGWSRREFVATVLGAAIALTLEPKFARAERAAKAVTSTSTARPVTLNVNGRDITLTLEPRVTLLDALREYASLTGTKKGCDHGQCGACTVHVDGRRTLSCLTLAVMQQGRRIATIEGLAPSGPGGDALHPMQQAFIRHDGFQCGYCTPGQIMSATAMVNEPWGAGDDDVREAMSGNLCRCGAYVGIVAAIQDVRQQRRAQ